MQLEELETLAGVKCAEIQDLRRVMHNLVDEAMMAGALRPGRDSLEDQVRLLGSPEADPGFQERAGAFLSLYQERINQMWLAAIDARLPEQALVKYRRSKRNRIKTEHAVRSASGAELEAEAVFGLRKAITSWKPGGSHTFHKTAILAMVQHLDEYVGNETAPVRLPRSVARGQTPHPGGRREGL